jgi:CHAT domain-containing protein/predicted Zn-dependent protease
MNLPGHFNVLVFRRNLVLCIAVIICDVPTLCQGTEHRNRIVFSESSRQADSPQHDRLSDLLKLVVAAKQQDHPEEVRASLVKFDEVLSNSEPSQDVSPIVVSLLDIILPPLTDSPLAKDASIHLERAVELHKAGKPTEAIGEYRRTLKVDPNTIAAFQNLGAILRRRSIDTKDQNEMVLSHILFTTALVLDPSYEPARRALATLFGEDTARDQKPTTNPAAIEHFNKAEQAFGRDSFDQAIEEYKEALSIDPQFEKAHLYLGDSFFRLGRFELAAKSYEDALRIDPRDDQAQRFLVDAYKKLDLSKLSMDSPLPSGDLVAASREARKALGGKASARDFYRLGTLYLARELYTPARQCFWRAARSPGQNGDLVISALRGIAFTGMEDIAENRFWQIAVFFQDDENFRLEFQKDSNQALQRYGFLVSKDVRATVDATDFSVLHTLLSRLMSARPPSPEPGTPQNYLTQLVEARVAFLAHNFSKTLDLTRAAIKAYQQGGASYALAGLASFEMEKHFTAAMYLKEAGRRGYKDPDLRLWIGAAYYLVGDCQTATGEFEKGINAESKTLTTAEFSHVKARCTQRADRTQALSQPKEFPSETQESKSEPHRAAMTTEQLTQRRARVDQLIREGEQSEDAANYSQALIQYDEAWRTAEEVSDRGKMDIAQRKAEAIRSKHKVNVSAEQFLQNIPALAPIVNAKTREEKLTVVRHIPPDRRRSIAPLFGLGQFFFEKERNLSEALIYAELELENAQLVPDGPPPAGEPVKSKLLGSAELAIGSVLLEMGKYLVSRDHLLKAESFFVQAEDERKKLGLAVDEFDKLFLGRSGLAFVYERLGKVSAELGENDKAREFAARARAADAAYQSEPAKIEYYTAQGEYFAHTQIFEKAFDNFEKALRLVNQMNFIQQGITKPGLLNRIAMTCSDLGLNMSAIDYLNEALELDLRGTRSFRPSTVGGEGRPPIDRMYDYRNLAMVYERMGDSAKAEANYRTAARYSLRDQTDDPESTLSADRTIEPAEAWPIFQRLGAFLKSEANDTADPSRRRVLLEEAFNRSRQGVEIVETTRRGLSRTDLRSSEAARIGYTRDKANLYKQVVSILEDLDAPNGDTDYMRTALQYAERSKSQVLLELLNERNLGSRLNTEALPLDKTLDELASRDLLVLEYYFLSDGVRVWCFGGKDRVWESTDLRSGTNRIRPDKLREQVLSYIQSLSSPEQHWDDLQAQGHRLYEILIPNSVRKVLDAKRSVIVVPHDFLHLLPFQALFPSGEPMAWTKDVSYAPSLEVLIKTLKAATPFTAGSSRLLAVLNPVKREELSRNRQQTELPILFPSPPSLYYTGELLATQTGKGDERQWLLSEMTGFDYIHIFTHGQFDLLHPLDSYLEFPSGRLLAKDIYAAASDSTALHLDAKLVTLTACETGRGDVVIGDEVLGLPRAFMYAGATSLLTTLWRADAGFADRLITHLYEKLSRGQPRGRAFYEALREVVATDEQYRHPFYWAPFVLIGDPR